MVAIFTGNGLGLERSSVNVLGGRGMIGSTGQGRASENVLVNAANGNLVINNRDEFLVGRGPDNAINRTYNSLGQFTDENGDNWTNYYSRVVDHGGAGINQPGAYLDRLDWDGGRTRYYWDGSAGAYVSKAGGGAHDRIGYDSGWWWQDGDSGIKEVYGAGYDNRVVSRADRDGNAITYTYASAAGNLSRVTTADGNYTDFVWSGNNLTQLSTSYFDTQTGSNKTLTRTRYVYSGNRLASVTTDLSPEDNSIADGRVYTTDYTYDGNGRVLTMRQTDGTKLTFTYDGQGRVTSSTEAVEAGVSRTTSYAYYADYTNVTDPQGNITSLYYDSAGQLTQVAEPPAVAGGPQRITDFAYYGNGDLYYTSTYEGSFFARTWYRYDNNGNVFDIYNYLPGQGYTVTRYYYGSKNELLTSTSYTGVDTDGHGGMEPSGGMTTRYIYDSETHLRFVASPEGRVTEYRYDAAGNRTSEIEYLVNNVGTAGLAESFTWAEQDYINWLATISDKSTTSRTDTTYDFRGNVAMVTGYARTDAAGNGILDDGASRTLYVYNQYGSLLTKRVVTGAAASTYANLSEFSFYDVSSTAAAAINGKPANQYIVQTAGGWTAVYNGMAAASENETITSSFTVMGTGTNPSLTLGIYGYVSAWGANENSIARIVSGPGQIVQEVGGLWNVTGLSNSIATRIEVTRIYKQSEGAGVYVYVDRPNGQRLGQGVILSDPVVSRSATVTESYAYDGMGRAIRHTDAKGVGTWTSYIDSQNRTVTTLASGMTTTSIFNRAGELVASTQARGGVAQENAINPDINSWNSNAARAPSGTLDGVAATQYTTASGQTYAYAYSSQAVEAGDTMTWTISLQGVGGLTSAALGIWAGTSGWASVNLSSARIVSGPGALAQNSVSGGYFDVSGLSATEVTRVEVTRVFTQAENAYPHFYTYGAVGQGVLVGAQSITKSRYMTAGGGGTSFDVGQFDINNWGYGGATREAAGTIGSAAASKFTVQAAGQWTGVSTGIYAVAGDTITSAVSLKAANGGTSASFGIYGNSTGWAYDNNVISSARIISGPGTLTQEGGGLWNVTGLSDSQETRIEITRTFQSEESGGVYLYPNRPEGWIAGRAVIAGATSITKTAGSTSTVKYDSLGQLRLSTDALGFKTYYLYDKRGRKTAEVGANGELVEYRYDTANRVVATIRYHYAPAAAQLATLADPNNTLTINNLRTSADSGIWLWNVYDKVGRLIEEITGDGRVTTFAYDGANRLIETRKYVNLVSVASFMTTAPETAVLPGAHASDAVTRLFYDNDGLAIGALNAEGYLTESVFDKAGQLVEQIGYAQQTNAGYWATGTFDQLRSTAAPASAANRRAYNVYDSRGLQSFAVNAQGVVTKFVYDAAGRVNETRVYATPISTSNYSHANITALVNAIANGATDRVATTIYDIRGQVASTTDAAGLVTLFTYDAVGNVIKAVAGGVRTTRNWYTQKGELRFVIDAEGYVSEFNYDALGQLLNTIRYEGATNIADGASAWAVASAVGADYAAGRYQRTRATYDAFGQVIDTYDADNIRTNVWYRGNGEAGYVSVAYGTPDQSDAQYFGYNHSGQVTWKGEAWGETAGRGDEQRATSYSYDGQGNLASVVDPNSKTTSYTYDKLGRVTSVTDAAGGVTLYQYDAFGNQTAMRDARGYWTYNYYDNLGRLTQTTDASGVATTSAYTNFGELASVSRAGATTGFQYDKLGRVTRSTDALGFFETYVYDALGSRISKTAKSATGSAVTGGATTYTYDRRGLLLSETLPMASYNNGGGLVSSTVTNTFTYDANGNRTQMVEAAGLAEARTTQYFYDKNNRLNRTILPAFQGSAPSEYIYYDARGNVTSALDAAGGRTVFFYDDLNRKTVEINAVGTYTKYTYDKNGNVTEIRIYENAIGVPADGGSEEEAPAPIGTSARLTTFTYDSVNRMVTSSVHGAKTGVYNGTSWVADTSAITTTYQYDANGNVVRLTDAYGNSTYSYYDALGRKTHQVDQENYLTYWAYNADGNVTAEYRYANRVASPQIGTPPGVTGSADDRITGFGYDLVGNRTSEARYNVLVHNGAGVQTGATAVIYYSYNGLGQVVRKTEATGDLVDYNYDAAGRLTVESRSAYYDQSGAWVTPTVDYYYNGVNDLSRTRQRGSGDSAERITMYGYSGSKLAWTLDAEGNYRHRWYDQAGRQTYDYYTRYKSDGLADTSYNGNLTSYDAAGRVVQKWQADYSGNTWTTRGPLSNITYNAFGDVIYTYVGGILQQQSQYDLAGRMTGTTSGDGIWKHFGYDKNGNQTLAITNSGSNLGSSFDYAVSVIGASTVNATYTQYDKRNMAVAVVEEQRQYSAAVGYQNLTTSRAYTAFGEVASETNAMGYAIIYTYNTMGRLIRSESPAVEIVGENGVAQTVRPAEDYYYDVSGRLVATRDANGSYSGQTKAANTGNLTRLTLLTGTGYGGSQAQVTLENHADGGYKETKYDIHGDARLFIDEVWRQSTRTYDRMGRVASAANGAGLVDHFAYDILGQQIKHWNNYWGAYEVETTDYDIQGRVISQRSFGGDVTTTSYEWQGFATAGIGTFGGWLQTTYMANGLYAQEKNDTSGRVTWKRDLGGYTTDYAYDVAGRMSSSSSNGMLVSFGWYNSGLQYSVTIGSVNAGQVNTDWSRDVATYSYNTLGSRLTEYMVREIGDYTPEQVIWYNPYEPEYIPESYYTYTQVIKNQSATYDALGRMANWAEAGTATAPASSTSTSYDASGNVRRTLANYYALDANGSASYATTRDYWFRYDSMNRVVTNQGILENGAVVRGTGSLYAAAAGQDILYNAAGERAAVATTNAYYDGYGGYSANEVRENYLYDNAGRLSSTYQATGATVYGGYGGSTAVPAATGTGTQKSVFYYDLMGRMTSQSDYDANGYSVIFSRTAYYNTKGQLYYDSSSTKKNDNKTYTSSTSYYFTDYNSGQYMLGSVGWMQSTSTVNNANSTTSRTVNSYAWRDGAVQTSIQYRPNINQSTVYTTSFTLNALGQMTSAYIADGKPRSVSFTLDEIGQIIRRDESGYISGQTGNPHEVWYRFGGRQLGYTGNNGTSDLSYDASVADRRVVSPNSPGTFRNQQAYGGSYADFAQNYDPINSFYQGAAGGTYRVNQGDTLSGIAQSLYGDSSLWYKIAEANGLSAAAALVEGQTLVLPTGVMNSKNNAGTFKPYNAGEAIGDLSPTTPQPPKKPKCGVFGQILLVVIAVAVSIVTYGALTGPATTFLGAVGAGALAGAAGSVVSQAVGVATGIQDKFSFKAVALAAIGGAVGGGLGKVGGAFGKFLNADKLLSNVVKGALGSTITQGIGVATGLQSKFDFAGVAAAGLASGVSGAVARSLGVTDGNFSRNLSGYSKQFISSAAASIASSAAYSLATGNSFGDTLISTLPSIIGVTIGSALGHQLAGACFVAGTLIHTDRGLKPIEKVKPGDRVVSRDESFRRDDNRLNKVIETYRYEQKKVISIKFSGDIENVLLATPEHRFATVDNSWKAACDLKVGDKIKNIEGFFNEVIYLEDLEEFHDVYNFAVENDHTYFVSSQGIWVHNEYETLRRRNGESVEAVPVKEGGAYVDRALPRAIPRGLTFTDEARHLNIRSFDGRDYILVVLNNGGSELRGIGLYAGGISSTVAGQLQSGELISGDTYDQVEFLNSVNPNVQVGGRPAGEVLSTANSRMYAAANPTLTTSAAAPVVVTQISVSETTIAPTIATPVPDVAIGGSVGALIGTSRGFPAMEIQWVSTQSPWTGRGGLSGPLAARLQSGGVVVSSNIRPAPLGGLGRGSGTPLSIANNINGRLAEQALMSEFGGTQRGVYGNRVTDLSRTNRPFFSWNTQTIDVESKLGYRPDGGLTGSQADRDIARLTARNASRLRGFNISRGLGAVGLVASGYELSRAFGEDGNSFGVNSRRTTSGIAGGLAGAYAGAEIGAAIGVLGGPVGIVVGGVVGGIIGGLAGDYLGRQAYNQTL